MPPPPKLGDTCALIRLIEIYSQPITEQQCHSDCHIAVAAEVAVNLHGITIHSHQVFEAGIKCGSIEHTVNKIDADVIADYCFLKQPGENEEHGSGAVVLRDFYIGMNLRKKKRSAHNGSRHEVRKEADVKTKVENIFCGLQQSAIHINGVTEHLESVKRNADRQHNIHYLKISKL